MLKLENFKVCDKNFLTLIRGGADWRIVGTSTYPDGRTTTDIEYTNGDTVCDIADSNMDLFK